MTSKILISTLLVLTASACSYVTKKSFTDFGIVPNSGDNASPAAEQLVNYLTTHSGDKPIVIQFPKGRYDFYEEGAFEKEYYISNHDHENKRRVVFALEKIRNVIIDGQGSSLIFHGRMIPFSLIGSENVTLKNFSIDFELPHLRQLNVKGINPVDKSISCEIYPSGNYSISEGELILEGPGYQVKPILVMPFAPNGRLTYLRRDLNFNPTLVEEVKPNILKIYNWQVNETAIGEQFVLRSYYRPTPGIFVSHSKNTIFKDVKVHYAEGMGLLAQASENFLLDGFSVCLNVNDRRCFTTQADATHFSGCKGTIISQNGLYESMADDAINVHGTYLKVLEQKDDHTLIGAYMHNQSWGFDWGFLGDSVQFMASSTLELIGKGNKIKTIEPFDNNEVQGAKEFRIIFENKLPDIISAGTDIVIENLEWTPEVIFQNNLIRNNRARGALFSTPKKVICEDNIFDHTHGTAILLCGDANGWYETGACKDVTIRRNTFTNSLTAYYQFTNAIISIYPVIPNLEEQRNFFHSGIVIEDNVFETFDKPILYAKSVNGLIFKNNRVVCNNDFEAFHWNKHMFFFEKVNNVNIVDNDLGADFNPEKDIKATKSNIETIAVKYNTKVMHSR